MGARRYEEKAGDSGRVVNGKRFNSHDYKYVRLLEDVRAKDLSLASGKGANEGEIIKAGLPVSEVFVVLVDGYRKFVEENELEKEIKRLQAGLESKTCNQLSAQETKGDSAEASGNNTSDVIDKLLDLGQVAGEIQKLYSEPV